MALFCFNDSNDDMRRFGISATTIQAGLENDIHPLFRRERWLVTDIDRWVFDCTVAWAKNHLQPTKRMTVEQQLEQITVLKYVNKNSLVDLRNVLFKHTKLPSWSDAILDRALGIIPWESNFQRILPTVRLASRLLDLCLPFLWQLYHGKCVFKKMQVREPGGGLKVEDVLVYDEERRIPRADELIGFNDTVLSTLIADRIWFWRQPDLLSTKNASARAGYTDVWTRRSSDERCEWVDIEVDGGFLELVTEDQSKRRLPYGTDRESLHSRHAFEVALTLVHEVAHVVHKLKYQQEPILSRYQKEPFYDRVDSRNWPKPELGNAIETYLLGGFCRFIGYECVQNNAGLDWTPRTTKDDTRNESGEDCWAISQISVNKFLIEEVWKSKNHDGEPMCLVLTPYRAGKHLLHSDSGARNIWTKLMTSQATQSGL